MNSLRKKLLIASDVDIDVILKNVLSERLNVKTDVDFIDSTGSIAGNILFRHISYFIIALRVFLKRNDYCFIVFWQQFIGIYYVWISRFLCFNCKSPKSLLLHLIYKRRPGLFGYLFEVLFRIALKSDIISVIVCHARNELSFYSEIFGSAVSEKIKFIQYGVRATNCNRSVHNEKEVYCFSGGTSNRDYKSLFQAFEGINSKLIVVCFPKDIVGLRISPNVIIKHNVFFDEFNFYMAQSLMVIILLDNPVISSGHLVLLSAMSMGKAIIVTKGSGVCDYLDDSCALMVDSHNTQDIKNAILEVISNQEKRELLGRKAKERFYSNFTIERYAERIVEIITNS